MKSEGAPVVWFQGEPGAYSEAALLSIFPAARATGLATFPAVFDALAADPDGVAVLPIENAYAGTVYDVLDGLVHAPDLRVYAETTHPVALALMAPAGTTLADVVRVRSHPQALMQSRGYWGSHGWQVEVATDTAGSARELAERRWPGVAAIASPWAAARYGLVILEDGIQDHPDNRTRFWVVAHQGRPSGWWQDFGRSPQAPLPAVSRWKTSLVFETANVPGSLMRALTPFAHRGINLSKIESRPRPHSAFASCFWIDCEEDLDAAVLQEFAGVIERYRLLGRYPVLKPAASQHA